MKRFLCLFLTMVMILAVMPISSLGAESDIVSVSATGYNRGRGENHLVVFTPAYGAGTGTNAYGTEATVDAEGKIISVETGVGNASIPEGGFVISGHGDMSDWVKVNCIEGRYCAFNQNTLELQVSDSGFEFSLLGETFTPDEIGRMTKYRLERGQLTRNGIDVLLTSVDKLKKEKLHEQEKHGEDKFAALRRKRQSAVEQKNKNL